MSNQWTRRSFLRAGGTAGAVVIAGCVGGGDGTRDAPEASIPVGTAHQYSAPDCGCCERYASSLRNAIDGELTETVPDDIAAVKTEHGVPADLRSCHTLLADDYVVEGHVPANAIATLLDERPAIDGIALPGMPAGSPGMPGEKDGPFTIYAIGGGRTGEEYAVL